MERSINRLLLCPKIIGRTPELAALGMLVEQAKGGQGHLALLRGEAVIGKSRLVAETKALAAGLDFLLLQGNCFRSDRFFPYAPLLDLLRAYVSTHAATAAQDLKSLAPALSHLLPDLTLLLPELAPVAELPPLDPEQERHRLFAVLTHFLTQQAKQHPILLVIEDLHWSDETSLEFLLHLAPRCSQIPLLLLCTYRSDEFVLSLRPFLTEVRRARLAQELTLSPLSRDEVDDMLHEISLTQPPLPAGLLDALYPLTEGNPFFVEELLSASFTRAVSTLPKQDGGRPRDRDVPLGKLPFPRSVQEAVQQRTERLSQEARHVLTLAAVAGRRFDFAVLQQVLHCDEASLLALIKELIEAQLVMEESAEQFAFRHALTRQAIYEGLLARERASLHRTIAEAQGIAATLNLLAVDYAFSGDLVNTARYYERSIALLRAGDDPRALSSSLSTFAYWSSSSLTETTFAILGTKEACLRSTTESLQLAIQADWPSGQAFAELTSGHVRASFGEFGAALAHAHEGLHLATDITHHVWMAASYYVLAHIYALLLAPHLALQQAEAGLALGRESISTWWFSCLTTYAALAHLQRQELAQAEALLVTILPRDKFPRSLAERRATWVWGELALLQGKPLLALERAEHLLASAPGAQEVRSQPIPALLKLKGEALLALSRLDEAHSALEEAKRGARERGDPSLVWRVQRSLGQVYRRLKQEEQAQGEWAAAREIIAQGRSNREIAETLVISYRTVETHIANIMFKLSYTARSQVAAWVVEKGWMNPPV